MAVVIAAWSCPAGAAGLRLAGPPPTERAPASTVALTRIPTQTAPIGGKVRVKPSYAAVGTPQIISARLTVKKGSRLVINNKKKAKLGPGRYKIIQTVTYRPMTSAPETIRYQAGRVLDRTNTGLEWVYGCSISGTSADASRPATCSYGGREWVPCTCPPPYGHYVTRAAFNDIKATVYPAGDAGGGGGTIWVTAEGVKLVETSCCGVQFWEGVRAIANLVTPAETPKYGAKKTVSKSQTLKVK